MKKEEDTVRKKAVKALLFDLDGVLVDSLDAWFYVFNDTLNHFGFNKISMKKFKEDFGAPIEQDVKKYFSGKSIEEVRNVYNIKYKKYVKLVKLFPQSLFVLEKLKKKKIKLGLITNSTRTIALTIFKNFKLIKYSDVFITMDDVKRRKPAPDMVLLACKKLGIKPKNTILVGDSKNDMLAGKRAGCVTVGYKIKGDYKTDKLKEIERFIYVH